MRLHTSGRVPLRLDTSEWVTHSIINNIPITVVVEVKDAALKIVSFIIILYLFIEGISYTVTTFGGVSKTIIGIFSIVVILLLFPRLKEMLFEDDIQSSTRYILVFIVALFAVILERLMANADYLDSNMTPTKIISVILLLIVFIALGTFFRRN